MNQNQKHKSPTIEINDLINESIANAIERRNQSINSEDTLLTLSDKQASKIVGLGGRLVLKFPNVKL